MFNFNDTQDALNFGKNLDSIIVLLKLHSEHIKKSAMALAMMDASKTASSASPIPKPHETAVSIMDDLEAAYAIAIQGQFCREAAESFFMKAL